MEPKSYSFAAFCSGTENKSTYDALMEFAAHPSGNLYLKTKDLVLEDDIVAYVANTLTDVRQLQGFVTWLSAIRSTTPQK